MKKFLLFVFTFLLISPVMAVSLQPYNQNALEEAQKANRLIILHFFKIGCHTCHVQTAFLKSLKDEPDCPGCKNVVFFAVDVDDQDSLDLMNKVGVAIPTTLVVLQADQSLGQEAGQTDPTKLLAFINTTTQLSFKA